MSNYKLSIVIPVFNKVNFTKACMRDLVRLTADHELVVVDNGSADYTGSYLFNLGKDHENITVISLSENLGFAKACNLGYEAADSDNVLFLNNDIRVQSDYTNWTDRLISSCDKGLVGPTMGQINNKDFSFIKEDNKVLGGLSYLSGWCLAGSKEIFNQLIPKEHVGPFSEEFGKAYHEDTDLSFRAREIGINLMVSSVPVVHFGKQTSSQLNVHKLYVESKKIFTNKWKKLLVK